MLKIIDRTDGEILFEGTKQACRQWLTCNPAWAYAAKMISFAVRFLASNKGRAPIDALEIASLAASYTNLDAAGRQLFIERAAGHFVNVSCGHNGL